MRIKTLTTLVLVLLATLLLSACGDQQTQDQPQVAANLGKGSPAPNFTLLDMQGNNVSLADLKGKVVILNFWATWCPPCREEMPSMEMLHRKFKDQGLVMLAVNVEKDGKSLVDAFLKRTPYSFPILLDVDAEVQNMYKVFRFPETYIIDRNGNIVEKVIGAIDWTSPKAVQLINFLLNG
ncbi:Peroxiredoxin [Malonomonas rubra DSM 5091]|uniref:Peroxiredoxin n=1 Tax=Malonomonas rubra DSM 5091 TaxID=1122189 RepID=A0A1M6BWY4_MALRU|nr:TlpA disulfide reductase family protein [Malonomonas rubra]SHI53034.1 Peroxiredoxin [Malonomonas rubra DSM 5091]